MDPIVFYIISVFAFILSAVLIFAVLGLIKETVIIKATLDGLSELVDNLTRRLGEQEGLDRRILERLSAVEHTVNLVRRSGTGNAFYCTGSPSDEPAVISECTQSRVRRIIIPNGVRLQNKEKT